MRCVNLQGTVIVLCEPFGGLILFISAKFRILLAKKYSIVFPY